MLITVDEPADLAGCFIELRETGWSQRMLGQAYAAGDDNWATAWRQKVIACRLLTADGQELTDPSEVPDRLDDVDMRLYMVTYRSLRTTCDYLAMLGESKRRTSLGAGGTPTTTKTPTKTPTS